MLAAQVGSVDFSDLENSMDSQGPDFVSLVLDFMRGLRGCRGYKMEGLGMGV